MQIHNSVLSTVLEKTVFENNTGIKFFQTSISSSSQCITLSITKYKCNADQSGEKKKSMTVASFGQLDSLSGYMVPDQLSYSFTQYQIEIVQIKKKDVEHRIHTKLCYSNFLFYALWLMAIILSSLLSVKC